MIRVRFKKILCYNTCLLTPISTSILSTAAMYLRPAMKEAGSRLRVSANTLVQRVLFNGRRAIGIEYQTGGQGTPLRRAYARREVTHGQSQQWQPRVCSAHRTTSYCTE